MILLNTALTILFGLTALLCFGMGLKVFYQFFFKDYQSNQKARFRDNLVSNVYLSAAVACLIVAVFSATTSESLLAVLPCALGLGIAVLPIGIMGAYWRSYTANKLFGGFVPVVQQRLGFANASHQSPAVNYSDMKLPRKTVIVAAIVGSSSFATVFACLSIFIKWNGGEFAGFLFGLALASLPGFGMFMLIIAASLSRQTQRTREQQEQHKH